MKSILCSFLLLLLTADASSQNVGIGTTTPVSRLHVRGTGIGTQIVLEENAGSILRVSNEPSGTGPYIGTTTSHPLSLVTSNTVRVILTSLGNLGVGVSIPQQLLSVGGGVVIDQNNANTGTTANILSFGSLSGEGIGSKRNAGGNANGLDFYTNGLQRVSVTNSGNVGLGTPSPTQKLQVEGAIRIGNTATGEAGTVRYNAGRFEGNNGREWNSFEQLTRGSVITSYIAPDTALENKGYEFIGGIPGIVSRQAETVNVAARSFIPIDSRLYRRTPPVVKHTVVGADDEILVFGGASFFADSFLLDADYLYPTVYGQGYRYSFTTNLWDTLPSLRAPSPRFNHTAVWTGTEMIVWGGMQLNPDNTYTELNTGAQYLKDANSWKAMSAIATARSLHSAVWTGTEMIIWGGQTNGNQVLNTGLKYNPVTSTWTPISTINAPAARRGHTAIWTGTEMIIWGGELMNGTPVNGGALYNPVSNTWTTMSTINSHNRLGQSITWTGTEMLVFGGGSPSTSDGARYDPAKNSWVPTIAPSAKRDHGAVRTGNGQVLIWGGDGAGSNPSIIEVLLFNNGSWSRLPDYKNSTILKPVGIWTGNSAVFLGGYERGNPGNASGLGVRFFPVATSFTMMKESARTLYLYQKN